MELSYQAEQDRFSQKYKLFLNKLAKHSDLLNRIFARPETIKNGLADSYVYFLGAAAYEDFREILLLAGNGLSHGALKIVRGLYEKVITAARLDQHPAEAQAFSAYDAVHKHKLLVTAPVEVQQQVKGVDEIEKRFNTVKPQFMVTVCKQCGRQGLQSSWTPLDTYSLAASVDKQLADVYAGAFLLPTFILHTTALDVTNRVEVQPNQIEYSPSASEQYEKTVLTSAHLLLLYMARLQCTHFNLGLEEEINQAIEGHNKLWLPKNYQMPI